MTEIKDVLANAADRLNRLHKLEVAVPGTQVVKADVKAWIPTSSVLLNLLLGEENFGVPTGRVIELFGDNSHGKSTLAQIIMNAFQAAGGISVLLDSESAWDRKRAIRMGHIPEQHLAVEVDTCEMGFDVINNTTQEFKRTLEGKVPVVFVWDTIAASPTDGEKKGDEYESGMMVKPRLIRKELRRLTGELDSIMATVIFVNQTIEGPKPNRTGIKTTPGGGGIKFWSSQRLQVRRVAQFSDFGVKDKGKGKGIISEVKAVKNKLHPPNKTVDIPIDWDVGLDAWREVTNYLLDNTIYYNVVGAYKSIVGFQDEDIKFYEKNFREVAEKHPGLYEWMVERVKAHWFGLEE